MNATTSPAVSIVIPCYNYGHFLPETLASVMAQSWQNWECIIVDDGSIDNTAQVAREFCNRDPRFTHIQQPNQGVSSARNAGLDACEGLYVQLLDADDMLDPKKLERQMAYLEQHPATDIVYGNERYFQENNVTLNADITRRRAFVRISGSGHDVLDYLIRRNIMVINAPLTKISVFKFVGPFNERLAGNEDWEYWIRCALAGRSFHFLDDQETCALVRAHPHSATQNVQSMLSTGLAVREHLQSLELPPALRKENNYRIALLLAKLAKWESVNGAFLCGFKHGLQAIWRVRGDKKLVHISLFLLTPLNLATRAVLAFDRLQNILRPPTRR